MKVLMVRDMNGNILLQSLIDVDGDEFIHSFTMPMIVYLKEISLLDDEETRKAKEENNGS